MTKDLEDALRKRGRTWGERNEAEIEEVRTGKAPTRPFNPFRFRVGEPTGGQYVTRIPRAA